MSQIFFATSDDSAELVKALTEEGYRTALAETSDDGYVLSVEPWDERVVEMVDVYGGWIPGDERLPD